MTFLPAFLTGTPVAPQAFEATLMDAVAFAIETQAESELDTRCDTAEDVLDFYTDLTGTTGTDRADVTALIVDLLHLLDDTYPEEGQIAAPAGQVLLDAHRQYEMETR